MNAIASPEPDRFALRRLPATAAVTLVGSVVTTVIIRAIAINLVDAPTAFTPLHTSSVIFFTVLGAIAATLACAVINRVASRPVDAFRRIVPFALIASFIPDIAIWASHGYQHTATASTVVPLLVMHVAVATICRLTLPALGVRRVSSESHAVLA